MESKKRNTGKEKQKALMEAARVLKRKTSIGAVSSKGLKKVLDKLSVFR